MFAERQREPAMRRFSVLSLNVLLIGLVCSQQMPGRAINVSTIVTNRVRQINAQSRITEVDSLSRLESLIRSTAPLAGRKLLFFISDGFVVDARRSNGSDEMRRVVNEAATVGTVIYSLSTRSNSLGPGVDVSKNEYPDFSPRTASRELAQSKLPQEPLETLAEETGGRSYLDSSALDDGVAEALTESSAYYLLAWRPDGEDQRAVLCETLIKTSGIYMQRVVEFEHDLSGLVNETDALDKFRILFTGLQRFFPRRVSDQSEAISERSRSLKLRFDDHFSGAIDVAPLPTLLDRKQTFRGILSARLSSQPGEHQE